MANPDGEQCYRALVQKHATEELDPSQNDATMLQAGDANAGATPTPR